MTLLEFKHKFTKELSGLYPDSEIRTFLKLLLQHRLHFSSTDIALKSGFNIEKHDLDFLLDAFAELKKEKPIQYIVGETEFYGLPFKVTKDTLIPRPETEELVAWVLTEINEKVKNKKEIKFNILDIGTGSGCIAIALAKHIPNATIHAVDISTEALKIAKHNAALNDVLVYFKAQDMLDPDIIPSFSEHFSETDQFDIIVSNPPYVRHLEKEEIHQNVLKYEPHKALFVADDNALIFYDKIADFASKKLAKDGHLFFEINQYLSVETQSLLQKKKFASVELKKDLFDNYRMIKASL